MNYILKQTKDQNTLSNLFLIPEFYYSLSIKQSNKLINNFLEEVIEHRVSYTLLNGKNEGIKRWWCENGKLEYEEIYKREGIHRERYENGQLKLEYNYKNDKREGLSRVWHENGKLKYECYYKDGKIL